MQLDMTDYDGSANDITLMTDYTSSVQNSYIASLLDTYLPAISYGYDSCGYGCSDHASWTSADTSTPPPPPPAGGELENGVAATGLNAVTGADLDFTMDVPAGITDVNFTMSGGTGDGELYFKLVQPQLTAAKTVVHTPAAATKAVT
jgi:leucyl aminopeptidase